MDAKSVLIVGPRATWVVEAMVRLERGGARVWLIADGAAALQAMARMRFDLVLITDGLDGRGPRGARVLEAALRAGLLADAMLVLSIGFVDPGARPLRDVQQLRPHQVAAAVDAWCQRTSAPVATGRVLIADDDEDMRALLVDGLAAHGFEVLGAKDGLELLDALDAAERAGGIDAVVTDVRMPRLDGVDALARIRHWNKSLPVFLISGFADVAASRYAQLGAEAMLAKPVDVDELARRLRATLVRATERAPSTSA